MLKPLFWILSLVIASSYLGYPLLLLLLFGIKRIFTKTKSPAQISDPFPNVTLLVAAFNEKEIIEAKMQNTLALHYPSDKLNVVWVTDGSDDGTPELLKQYPTVRVYHQPGRKGKTVALNRAMDLIDTPFVVFSDANTMLDPDAINRLISCFTSARIGCVAGEKRIMKNNADTAAGSGEGTYWQYESCIKRLESGLYSALAAAGELYAIRTELYSNAQPDSIIDDFVISIKIAMASYRIRYSPEAFALETPSKDIKEELKRKIRIASGSIQTVIRFFSVLNFFRYGFLSFEFFSHKLLRWLFVPFFIPVIFVLNFLICMQGNWHEPLFNVFIILQLLFYFFVIVGWFALLYYCNELCSDCRNSQVYPKKTHGCVG
jgi:cellulose synthase/poly-beta-1,6-N-acetylglucosamine synthase-like glycosyltransferase